MNDGGFVGLKRSHLIQGWKEYGGVLESTLELSDRKTYLILSTYNM